MATIQETPNRSPKDHGDLHRPELSVEEQLTLFAGKDAWHFNAPTSLGFKPMQVADCGHGVTLVAPPYGSATCFPTSVGMAATWNRDLIEEVGSALGRETRAKSCSMLLGPMVNLHRIPCGGRNYETFSEDPVLTGKMAAAIIRGIQAEGTSACIKSFACNNQQHEQKTTSSDVDPRTLRELYLKIFAIAFEESDPWAVMTSYNPINGEHPGDSYFWMEEMLRQEMGFEGVVVSDWRAIQGEGAISSGVDIEMPGPGKVLNAANLKKALEDGLTDTNEIERKASRIVKLYQKCQPALDGDPRYSPPELDSSRHRELCRRVAEESITLLKNEGRTLPLKRDTIKRLAVIGPNAASARLGGGGSASVSPFYSVSPLEGIRNAAGQDLEICYAEGCAMGNQRPAVPAECFRSGEEKPKGSLKAEYFEVDAFENGEEASRVQEDPAIDFSWGWASPTTGLPREFYAVRWTGFLELPEHGDYTFSISTQEGVARVYFGDRMVLDAWSGYDPSNFEDAYTNRHDEFVYSANGAESIEVRIEYRKTGTRGGIHLGWKSPFRDDPISEAVEIARSSDAAVIVAGLCNVYEGGAYDRREFGLPGRQVELINAVAQANPKTIVILKNGTPVDLSGWVDSVPALLEAYYPGQEGGNAIARVLFGEVNPSGKLPDSLPNSWDEVPSMHNYPGEDGKAVFSEGMMVGYRHYDSAGIEPAFPFGFGLSYTTFETKALSAKVEIPTKRAVVKAQVTNSGDCAGAETVQLYLEIVDPRPEHPPRSLVDFQKVYLEPGESRTLEFHVRDKDLLTYDPSAKAWLREYPRFRLGIGNSSRSLESVSLPL